MKIRKLIMWSGTIQLLLVIIMGLSYILIDNLHYPKMYLVFPILSYMFIVLINYSLLSFSIKEKVWLTLYDETVEIKEKGKKEWDVADDYVKMLGNHEAVKLYKQAYPEKVPLKFYPFEGEPIVGRKYWVKTDTNSALAWIKNNDGIWLWAINGKPIFWADIKLIYDFPENL